MLIPVVTWLYVSLVVAGPTWEAAFEAQPDPGKRDLFGRDYFVVELAEPEAALSQGWTLEEPFPITDHWLFSVPKGVSDHRKRCAEADVLEAKRIYASEPKKLNRRAPIPVNSIETEFDIKDPLFKDQWYLYNPIEEGHDMNVVPVWRRNITGRGVTVAIVDDGLDYDHPDFAESFSLEGSWDYNLHQNHPKPLLQDDTHGTRCAGEVAAGINNACGVGIAPGAKVAGIRILSGHLLQSDEARSLIHRFNVNDIYSCSWGPEDNGLTIDGPPPLVKRAELEGIENGRNGKGSIYVVASGNGDYVGDNCNYDGYTNSIYSITIGAVDRHNAHPYYAESCSANMAVTYSSNYYDKISTSDRLNPENPSDIKCTSQHSGTSAAAPIAAGIFALVLEQRPDLTWRDLQYLARETAKQFDIIESVPPNPVHTSWQRTADGHYYHNSFGYGLLDADAIVKRAESWQLVKPYTWYFMPERKEHAALGSVCEVGVNVSKRDWDEANMDHIEHVRVRVSYEHDYRGVLRFQLESPAGIISDLAAPRQRDANFMPVKDWEFMSVVHWGEQGEGLWKLRVYGNEDNHGELQSWQLKLFGQAKDTTKTRRFSEVWDEYEPHAEVVQDAINLQSTSSASKSETISQTSRLISSATDLPESRTITAPNPLKTTDDGNTNITVSSTSSATTSSETSGATSTSLPISDDKGDEQNDASPHHSVIYYILVSMIGVGVIVLCAAPIFLCYLKRQANSGEARMRRVDLNDSSLLEDEFELDDFEDDADNSEYAVSDADDREHNGPENENTRRTNDSGNRRVDRGPFTDDEDTETNRLLDRSE